MEKVVVRSLNESNLLQNGMYPLDLDIPRIVLHRGKMLDGVNENGE